MKKKNIIIMGGGTAGWIAAFFLLSKNNNFKVKLISSSEIGTIGVGEGTTPAFTDFIDENCDKFEFLKKTKSSLKYGIKFKNWNFDGEHYYHLFDNKSNYEKTVYYDYIQYIINQDLDASQDILQKKIHGVSYDLLEEGKIRLQGDAHAYHFSANLIIPFFKEKCEEFESFEHVESKIQEVIYRENGYIDKLKIDQDNLIEGDYFINCLGFSSIETLREEYFDIEYWDDYILNDSAFAIQVKNSDDEIIEPYTTCTAQEFGWSWKIPQYEKTGYGYVFSSKFIDDEEKLYDDLINSYNITESNVFRTKKVKSKAYFNKKQIHKNCLSLGLASGFIEPLEATSIHMTLTNLNLFQSLVENIGSLDYDHSIQFNNKIRKDWNNILKFVVFHYFTKNPINEYWKHYSNIENNEIFEFYERNIGEESIGSVFADINYKSVSLGMRKKYFDYSFSKEKTMSRNLNDFVGYNSYFDGYCPTHNTILNEINSM